MTNQDAAPKPTFPDERLAAIQRRLAREGRVVAAELAREFDTSEDTIRRDLRDLAAAGRCRRVYGGALAASPAADTLPQRRRRDVEAKAALGRTAATLVRAGQLVCIDAGSTNAWIARALPDDLALTVATNAPSIAILLEAKPAIEVVLLGGRFDRRSGGTLGARTVREARALRPDLYVLGACAADPGRGFSVFDGEEAELKRALVAASAAVAAAVTDAKLGTVAPHVVANWGEVDHLVVTGAAALARCGAPSPDGPALHHAARPGTRP